tara:strand:- start:2919 stop:3608 length:690 start_codon:yes stop_codon:yes gene_type:complete
MKKFILIIITLIFSFYVLVEFIGDRLVKNVLEDNISSSLDRKVLIKKLNIDYLSGKANLEEIELMNKNFEGYMIKIENIKVALDTFSIFTNDIIINNVLLNNIKVNYYFNFKEQKISDNLRSLEKDLRKKSSSKSNKFFNIQNLSAKNISLSVLSPELDIEKSFKLNDMNFKNIGNTNQSKNYKDVLKKFFVDTVEKIKEKVSIEDILNNFDVDQIENKVKDKLKKLIN